MKKILIINGPNLNLLGRREPEIYGSQSFDDYLASLRVRFPAVTIEDYQSNSEGKLIDRLHQAWEEGLDGIVINPGAYAHYSHALADAIRSITVPVVEVHISNIHSREEFRHTTVTGGACRGIITGLGLEGYALAITYFCDQK